MHALKTLAGLLGAAALVSAECTRDALIASAQTYLAAQTAGKLDGLALNSDAIYKENNKAADIKGGILNTPLKIDTNRTTADVVECASYTMLISTTGAKPYVIATQIRHGADNDTSTIASIDSIVATTGALFFNAKKTLGHIQAQNWSPIPEGQRPSRELLKKYGDGYLDMWTDANAAGSMKWGADCERVEGSQYTKPCGQNLPRGGSKKRNGDRRYVIDETLGSVDVLCNFDSLGNYADSHEIRVENGAVKYVHTVTVYT